MKNWFKKYWLAGLIISIVLVVAGIYSYNRWYVPYKHSQIVAKNLENGFVVVDTFDCPKDHPIKAHLGSMIYHLRGDPYYDRTSASNGYCFDNANNAEQQGFRKPYNR